MIAYSVIRAHSQPYSTHKFDVRFSIQSWVILPISTGTAGAEESIAMLSRCVLRGVRHSRKHTRLTCSHEEVEWRRELLQLCHFTDLWWQRTRKEVKSDTQTTDEKGEQMREINV